MEIMEKQPGLMAIFFDLDNTLIVTRKGDSLACEKISKLLWEKYAVPPETSTKICNNYLISFRNCPDNPSVNLDTWRKMLWAQALGDQYHKHTEKIYEEWLKLRYEYLALTSEIKHLLKNLRKHYLLGLITNGPSCAQWEKVERLKLKPLFDLILVSGDLPWKKPHHKIFHEACEYLGVEPRQCIMIGDRLSTDILGGIRAKLGATVWVPLEGQKLYDSDPNPNFIIDHVNQLPTLLPKVNYVGSFRDNNKLKMKFNKLTLADIDDCNSNCSDGS